MISIILAGGEGTRLRPLTYKMPKALIPVQGKTLTEHSMDIFRNIGISDFYLSISYLADQMIEYFGHGEKFGVKIKYLQEKNRMGTAGPLLILKQTSDIPRQDFFMCNGDNLFACDFKAMLAEHQKNKALATIALVEVEDPTPVGIAKLDGDRIIEFVEKPTRENAPSKYANSGYYIISPEIFKFLPDKDFVMMENEIFPAVAKAGGLFGFKSNAQWFDTGTPERYERVKNEWAGPFKYK